MKAILALPVLFFGLQSVAATEIVLNCTSLGLDDISTAIVRTYEDSAKRFSYEMVLTSAKGEVSSFEIETEDYSEGYIQLPHDGMTERYLNREQDGWFVVNYLGDSGFVTKAQCEEAPLY
ncbi:hypothetical protein [Bdellovibrio reynosensis]|uniref:C-type lysozyme inhibitor domain-containing protein n=1 Tax=Bdellovibrio reynosensis TaxID=2835041 RepID=A0ABY4C8B6_9BACT|nr:hypothetical protein [Bdellovibrio reynosensis]UOF01113.1 hypothetical protein MNR06_15535 [Bdellovibrio reynosensis]